MSERDVTPARLPRKLTPRGVVIVIVAIILIAIIFSSFYVVDQQEQAVILRFGKFMRITEPGLHFKLPFGIDKNFNVPTQRVLKEEFGFRTERPGVTTVYSPRDYPNESIMLTGDLLIVDVEWIIQYRISDPRAYLFNVENPEKTIRDISQSVVNLLVGDRAINSVLTKDRATIEDEGKQLMNEFYTKYDLGVRVTTVKLQNVVPPTGSVQQAYEDVNVAIQDRDRSINEGIEAYNKAIPKAEGTAKQLIQEAEGYALRRVNEAKGDVARFRAVYQQYRVNPEVTRKRLYYEMWEQVFSNATENTDLIDRNLRNFIPFKSVDGGAGLTTGGTR